MQVTQQLARLQLRSAQMQLRTASFLAQQPTPDRPRPSDSLGAADSSNYPPINRPKPTEPSWYTGSPGYYSVLNDLQQRLHAIRAHLHAQSILPEFSANPAASLKSLGLDNSKKSSEDRAQWLQHDRMALHLGTKLSLSQYRKLTGLLNSLRALKPHLQLADSLGSPFSDGSSATQLEEELAKYTRSMALSSAGQSALAASGTESKKGQLDQYGRSYAVGRRKESSAQAWISPADTEASVGQVLINAKPLADYFASPTICADILQPLRLTDTLGQFNVFALAKGGGTTGQAGALRLAIAKALLPLVDEISAAALKKGASLSLSFVRTWRFEAFLLISHFPSARGTVDPRS